MSKILLELFTNIKKLLIMSIENLFIMIFKHILHILQAKSKLFIDSLWRYKFSKG